MQLSSDLPCGIHAVRDYIAHRGDTRLPMNVSAEADADYVAEKGLRIGPVALKSWPVGTCTRCGGTIHNAPFLGNKEPGESCSRVCRDNGELKTHSKARRRTRHFKNCKQCQSRFLAKRADQEFCKAKCRVRWNRNHPNVTDNCADASQVIVNAPDTRANFALPPVSAPTPVDFGT